MTDEATQDSNIPADPAPLSDGAPEPVAADPTPAQLLGIASGSSADDAAVEQTPAQLLGVTPDLAANLNLEEPQGRDADLATEVRKGAGSSDTPSQDG